MGCRCRSRRCSSDASVESSPPTAACSTLRSMLKPFFVAAMLAPGRHRTFRRLAVAHVLLVGALSYGVATAESPAALTNIAYLFLVLGIVEGSALVGWRLTQLPKSQALEFLLTSPVQPRRVFLAEALVGVARFALVWFGGLPIL